MSDRYGSISISEEPATEKKTTSKPRQPHPPRKKKTGSSKPFWGAFAAAFVIGCYFLTATYLVPMALKKYLPSFLLGVTGLQFSVEHIQLNPFNFQLTFTDIEADLPAAKNQQPLLQIPHLFIDMDLTSLLRNSFVCDKLLIEQLSLNVTRFNNRQYNLPVLTRFAEEKSQEQIMDFTQLPFLFSINNIDISDSQIVFTDQVRGKQHSVEQLHLAIPTLSNFSFQLKEYILPHFSALINGSFIQLDGKKIPLKDGKSFQTKLYCSVKNLELGSYLSYLPEDFPLTLTKGVADLNVDIGFSPQEKQGKRIAIDINMAGSDIFLHTKKGTNKISIPHVTLDATLSPANKKLHIKSVVAKKPQLMTSKAQLPRGLANFLATGAPSSKRLGLAIDLLLIDEGRLVLTDHKDLIWNGIQLSMNNFDSSRSQGTFRLSGQQAAGPGSFSWQGTLQDKSKLAGKLQLNNFPADMVVGQLYKNAATAVKGTTEVNGHLVLSTIDKTASSYTFDNATLLFNNLTLLEKKEEWLFAESVRLTRFSKEKDRFILGNIFLKNAALHLTHNSYPSLFNHLFSSKERPQIMGIDFSGKAAITPNTADKKPLLFSELTFQANKLNQEKVSDNYILTANIGKQGVIKARGTVGLSPFQLETELAFADIDSALFSPYVGKWPLLYHSKAMLHGKGTFTFPAPSYRGALKLTDGHLQLESDKDLFTWDSAEFDTVRCTFSPFSLHTIQLMVQSPRFQLNMDGTSPFQRINTHIQKALAKNDSGTDYFPVQIKKVSLNKGSLSLLDQRSTSIPWQEKVTDLSGHLNNIDTQEKGISAFALQGNLAEAPFELSGSTFLFQEQVNSRARLSLDTFPLASFTDTLKKSGLVADNGTASVQTRYVENDTGISSTTDLTLQHIRPLSVKTDTALALALLKDNSGSFTLRIERDNMDRSLFQEAIDTFGTTVIKATYAPLLLDQNFSDLQENTLITFHPGTNTINSGGKELAIRYSELLAAHPDLRLSITGMADPEKDLKALQNKMLLQTPKQLMPAQNPKGQPSPPPPQKISTSDLLTLAKERSLIVYDFFIHSLGIAPARLTINDSPLIPKNTAGNGSSLAIGVMATTK